MTIDVLNRDAHEVKGRSSAYRDNVLPDLATWSERGERCALVTLVGVDGNAPRAEGAQMAVSERGQWAGYISGGCLEQAIALEAVQAIKAGKPRLLRYGKGSPYFDIQLPCGSGLDVLVEPFENEGLIREMRGRMERREPFALRIGLESGTASHRSGSRRRREPAIAPEWQGLRPGLYATLALPHHRLKPNRGEARGAFGQHRLRDAFLRPRCGNPACIAR